MVHTVGFSLTNTDNISINKKAMITEMLHQRQQCPACEGEGYPIGKSQIKLSTKTKKLDFVSRNLAEFTSPDGLIH